MRFLADIPDDDVKWLDDLAREQGKSRAAVLRAAVSAYRADVAKGGIEQYFGLWARSGSAVDGLAFERTARQDWGAVRRD